MKTRNLIAFAAVAAALGASADMEKGNHLVYLDGRLTLKPTLSFSYTYDSNIDSTHHSKSGSQWIVNPRLGFDYKTERVDVTGAAWYQYHAYNRYTSQLNESSYGEMLGLKWADSEPTEAGWLVSMNEKFEQIAQDDDMSEHDGRGIGRDRMQITANAIIERRFASRLHGAITGSYYLLDYDNDVDKYATLYGWKRVTTGVEAGYIVNEYTDLILAADYQWYWQDNDSDRDRRSDSASRRGHTVRDDSKGFSVMGGIQSRLGAKLSYRAVGGWSRFEYGDGAKDIDGWTYQVSGRWQVDDENTFSVAVLGSSYYQPSECEYGSAIKVYSIGGGLAKGLVRNKLNVTADLTYRKETHEYVEYREDDYDTDILTGRLGLRYSINNYASVYGRLEYQTVSNRGGSVHSNSYDYDRWRGTVGFMLSY